MSTSVFAPKTSCSQLVREVWAEPVPDAAAPVEGVTELATLQRWINFAIEQTAGKHTEYERGQEKQELQERCEQRDLEAIDDAKPGFLDFLG